MHRFAKEIAECVKKDIESKGIDHITPEELCVYGQWVDIAKDLADFDKNMRVIEEMDRENENDFMDRLGYDRYRYANGRFAPKGRGTRIGYQPYTYMQDDDWMNEYLGQKKYDGEKSRYGESYDRYDESRRHYHDTKDADSKRRMDDSMKTYTDDVIHSIKEMWSDADSTLRQTMKADLTKMIQQLQ